MSMFIFHCRLSMQHTSVVLVVHHPSVVIIVHHSSVVLFVHYPSVVLIVHHSSVVFFVHHHPLCCPPPLSTPTIASNDFFYHTSDKHILDNNICDCLERCQCHWRSQAISVRMAQSEEEREYGGMSVL